MLAASPEVAYISEPLNLWHRPGVMRAPVKHWYTYICEENQDQYLGAFKEMLRFEYHTGLEVESIRSVKDLFRMGRDWWKFLQAKRKSQLPLIKDPFAVFSSQWFSSCLGCQVVIIVRHPAAVASSLVKLDWEFDFQDLLDQPLLMRDWLEPFRGEMEQLLARGTDLIAQSCLLWRMVYQSVIELRSRFPQLIIIRHEEFSLDPVRQFEQLYGQLGIEFTPAVQEAIITASSEKNPRETSASSVHSVRIDSQASISSWQNRLSERDVERVFQLTSDVASFFYSTEDWGVSSSG
jgi:hypothetical protein